jgi:hypothetical protein
MCTQGVLEFSFDILALLRAGQASTCITLDMGPSMEAQHLVF